MYNKALSAVILMEAGHKDEARTALQSLMEHTVSKPGVGRYFDTDRATLTWEKLQKFPLRWQQSKLCAL